MPTGTEHIFPIRRRIWAVLGWALILSGVFVLVVTGLLAHDLSRRGFWAAVLGILLGLYWLRSVKNVREIRLDERCIRFMPVDVELAFSEITGMHIPGWADRHDNPPNIIGRVRFDTNTGNSRIVPGALVQWRNGCEIRIDGCDSDKLFDLLRRRIPAV